MTNEQTLLHTDGFTYNSEPSDIVQRLLKITSPKTAIDIGAGAGRNVSFLLENGCNVTAVECGPESLAILSSLSKRQPALRVIENTLQEFTTDKQFDAVLCNMTLHFLKSNEIDDALLRLKSVATSGGFVTISSYVDCAENDTLPESYTYRFQPKGLLSHFNGWKIHYYTEDYPAPSARVLNSGVNNGKGYISARIIAEKV